MREQRLRAPVLRSERPRQCHRLVNPNCLPIENNLWKGLGFRGSGFFMEEQLEN